MYSPIYMYRSIVLYTELLFSNTACESFAVCLRFRTKLFTACELAKANLSSTEKSTSVEFDVLDNLYFFSNSVKHP